MRLHLPAEATYACLPSRGRRKLSLLVLGLRQEDLRTRGTASRHSSVRSQRCSRVPRILLLTRSITHGTKIRWPRRSPPLPHPPSILVARQSEALPVRLNAVAIPSKNLWDSEPSRRRTNILLNDKPIFLRGISIHAEAPYRTGRACSDKDAEPCWVGQRNPAANLSASPITLRRDHAARRRSHGLIGLVGKPCVLGPSIRQLKGIRQSRTAARRRDRDSS